MAQNDWRIGLEVKPYWRDHRFYGKEGKVVDTLPSGTAGLVDCYGVLVVAIDGLVTLAPANEWCTA
jgi:hypothetical protein